MRRSVLKPLVLAVVASASGVTTVAVPTHAGGTAVMSETAAADAPSAAAEPAAAPPEIVSGAVMTTVAATDRGNGLAAMAAADIAASASSGTPGATPAPETTPTAAADHPTPIPEPSGYWTGPTNSPVPATLTGAKVILDAHRLQALLDHQHPALIDVSNAPRRPDNMAPGAPWLPLPHHAIPGTVWIPGPGAGEIPAAVDIFFRQQLAKATANDLTRPVVIYCHESCWLSWNAAKRALSYGYQHIYWYRDGIEGWKAAGLPTAIVEPQVAPEG